ncbi:hypothetical protein H7H78_14450 [Mycobacterium shinjukuense]|nr:hypothetical protein [Mycobacterium shinjukuense]ORB67311.1 hypothetical protein BST45_12775 [Mycobacterium shinjukuense]
MVAGRHRLPVRRLLSAWVALLLAVALLTTPTTEVAAAQAGPTIGWHRPAADARGGDDVPAWPFALGTVAAVAAAALWAARRKP